MKVSKIENDVQDRNSEAWKKLCDYVDEVAENGSDEFSPRDRWVIYSWKLRLFLNP